MRNRLLCILLLLAIIIPTVPALAAGEAQQFTIRVSDIQYTDKDGKTLDLTGLDGALAMSYLNGDEGQQAKMDVTVSTPEDTAFQMTAALDESYALFSFDQKTAYGSSWASVDPAVRDLFHMIEGTIHSASAVQRGESTADIVGALRASYALSQTEYAWNELYEVEIDFYGEPRRAVKRTASVTPDQHAAGMRKEMQLWGMSQGLIDILNATEEEPPAAMEYTWYDIGEREAIYESTATYGEDGGKSYRRTRAQVRSVGGEIFEVRETAQSWTESAPDKVETDTLTLFARRDENAGNAGQLQLTARFLGDAGQELGGYEIQLIPLRAKTGWMYDFSLAFDYEDMMVFADELPMSDYGEYYEDYDFGGLTDSPFGDIESYALSMGFGVRGTIAGEGGDSTFSGVFYGESKSEENQDGFTVNVAASFSPYLDGPIEIPVMEALIDVNNMDEGHLFQLSYDLIDAISRAYVVIQEMPAVKSYQNKTSRIADLAG